MSTIVKKRKYDTMRLSVQEETTKPPMVSDLWRFDVGGDVHPHSWGRKALAVRTVSLPTKNGLGFRKATQAKDDKWTKKDFRIKAMIGQGKFGSVFQAVYKSTTSDEVKFPYRGQRIAIKTLSKYQLLENSRFGGASIHLLQREVNIQTHLAHPHILPLYGFFESIDDFSLVMEYAALGDAYDTMTHLRRTVNQTVCLTYAKTVLWQVSQAVAYLEQVSVAHRDIKPENIVAVDNHTVKLADFGWACWYRPSLRHKTLCGTAEYLPPEILYNKEGYEAGYVDRWMIGVLAVELVQGSTPFIGGLGCDDTETIFDNIRAFRCFKADFVDPSFEDFVSSLLRVEPTERTAPESLLDHKFLRSVADPGSISPKSPTVAQRRQLFERTTTG